MQAGHSEQLAVLALARACLDAKVALWQASAVVERIGSAEAALAGDFEPEGHHELEVRVAAREFRPFAEQTLGDLDEAWQSWRDSGLSLTTVLDEGYPLNLRYIWNRPPFLFYRGELQADDALALAVVGTRDPTPEGRDRARRMSTMLVEHGITVLSGLAKGIDTEAHEAALAAGGRTIAVLGSGHEKLYPKENAELAERIVAQGAVVSQFFPATPPTRGTFPLRNTVTSGMGQGTIVIEASATSGARLQARLAVEHGKHAFFLESLLQDHDWAKQFAAKHGAVPVRQIEDVLAHLEQPADLSARWQESRDEIIRANAEPPVVARKRLADVAVRDQQQLPI